jgi:putative DNA-invertase from lambdoid prophage Rac
MRAALYHRVSTVDQNPEAAHVELRASALQRGHEIVLDVVETGSGANNNRPGLAEVFAAARRGKIDVLLVWKLDRFGRSTLDVITNIRQLNAAGVAFVSTTQGFECRPGGDAMSALVLQLLAAVAEFELMNIRERTRAGLRNARAKGVQLGRPRVERPELTDVLWLREARVPWEAIAAHLGCSVHAARSVVETALRKRGVKKLTPVPSRSHVG